MDGVVQALLARYVAMMQRAHAGGNDDDDEDDSSFHGSQSEATDDEPVVGDAAQSMKEAEFLESDLAFELRSYRKVSGSRRNSAFDLVMNREIGGSTQQACIARRLIPNAKAETIAEYEAQGFGGHFNVDGSLFMSSCQDQQIRIYDTTGKSWRLIQQVEARDIGWSIIDTDFSPDSRFAVYSSWSNCVHMINTQGSRQVHEALDFRPRGRGRFCMFAVKFSPDGHLLLGGSSDQCFYLLDMDSKSRIACVPAHENDVNTVCWVDDSCNTFVTGSDDCVAKLWDRRTLGAATGQPVGALVGHCDGLTHVSSRKDGRYVISNSKDQTIKLWDLRKPYRADGPIPPPPTRQQWDYRRWSAHATAEYRRVTHPADHSLQTYRGHRVIKTLIRCHFSPASTGRSYIYTGSGDGKVIVYDVLTGEIVRALAEHHDLVRDVSWHPTEPLLVSTSWDGTVVSYTHNPLVASPVPPRA